jgi:aminopeptidase C
MKTTCRTLFLLLLTSTITSTPYAADLDFPARSCAAPLKKIEPLSHSSAIGGADLEKSLLLPDAPVKNQGGYGCCWISSTLGKWERIVEKKFGKSIPLSENHLILSSLFYRVEEGIYYGSEIAQGGWSETADWMVTHIGLVPESAYTWKLDLREKMVGTELIGFLNHEIAKFQVALKRLKEANASEQEAWELAEATKSRLYRWLRDRVGNFPSKFIVEGKEYTPHSFAKSLTPPNEIWGNVEIFPVETRIARQKKIDNGVVVKESSLRALYPNFAKRLPNTKDKFVVDKTLKTRTRILDRYKLYGRSHNSTYGTLDAPLSEIHEMIDSSLKDGLPVFLATPMVKAFYKSDTGIMSLRAYGATVEDALKTPFSGGHAVLITGRYSDEAGKLLGYRIQNSWGEKAGSLGYYYMDIDYFDTFMDNILISQKVTKSP